MRTAAVLAVFCGILVAQPAQAQIAEGFATFYKHAGRTASGEMVNHAAMTAAHRTLTFGTMVKVVDPKTGRSVTVRINDRGPFGPGRVIDLTYGAAQALGIVSRGVARVRIEVVSR
jgi:rare lipoprotein A